LVALVDQEEEAYLGPVALAFLNLEEAWEALLHLHPVVVEVGRYHHQEVEEGVVQSSYLEEVEGVP
jgi:hypothetical protein